jgi:hypothetical protein
MAENFFADQFAVEFIRTSLWNKAGSRASVMVGAGFSRNAKPTSPSVREMPTWSQMAKALCALLYADASKDSQERALREASSTSGFLRLAQEYKAAFGQGALNEQIRALVPDLEYEPGGLHKALLQLPWTDVLTTNWDTLLERAALDIFDENYDVIRTHSQISSSARPRIVKLHGTLPAHEPFIFTEDDYRTYPRLHAPFVNLVQQTLMESVLCLIGFSGDDPNFLHWSGWVRDNLGVTAPKIYLVGWLELTPSRKRMLEDRNVVPIDLSTLPIASSWPLEQRHKRATEWFLHSISVREKYQPEDWPRSNVESPVFPSYIGHIAKPKERLPKTEPFSPSNAGGFSTTPQELAELLETWRWNREMYPGWAIAPSSARQSIWLHTQDWINPIIRLQSEINPYEFLRIIEELNWRLQIALAPHLPELYGPVSQCLNCFNFSEKSISIDSAQPDYEEYLHWPDLKLIWSSVAIWMVQTARTNGDFEEATRMLEIIASIAPDTLSNELTYEKILILRDSAELQSMVTNLQKWDTAKSDSIWAARKSGLLAGVGLLEEARNIVSMELTNIRKNSRRDTVDYASYSREAWLLWIEDTLNNNHRYNTKPENINRRKFLHSIKCDILRDFSELVDRLAVELNKKTKTNTGFYRNGGESITFTNGIESNVRTALEILRFSEVTGLPRAIGHFSVLGEGLRLASSALQAKTPFLSAMANIRGADTTSDERLDFWSRNRIASISESEFLKLYSIVLSGISFCLSCPDELYVGRWHTQLQIFLEIMARLSIRISAKQADDVLELIFKILNSRRCGEDIGLASPMRNLIGNVFLASTSEIFEKRILDIFSLPLTRDSNLVEVSQIFSSHKRFENEFQIKREKKLDYVIQNLIENLLSENQAVFSSALSRIRVLKKENLLSPDDLSSFSQRFWHVKCENYSLWVTPHMHHPWANFLLPCTEPRLRNQLFKSLYLANDKSGNKYTRLGPVGIARGMLRTSNEELDFSETEIAELKECVKQWCEAELKMPQSEFARVFESASDSADFYFIEGLIEIISELNLEINEAEQVFRKVKSTHNHLPSSLRLLPYLANYLPHRTSEIEAILRGALASEDEKKIIAVCRALWLWLSKINLQEFSLYPGNDIIMDLSKIIGGRRMSGLIPALQLGALIVDSGPEETRLQILRDSEIGMTLLFEDAKYNSRLAELNIDVANIRATMAKFALSITRYYHDAPDIFLKIIDSCSKDELVEVRNAVLSRQD